MAGRGENSGICHITIMILAYLPSKTMTLRSKPREGRRWNAKSEQSFTGIQGPLIHLLMNGKGLERTMSLFRWKCHLQGNRYMIKVCSRTPIVMTKNVSCHITVSCREVKKDPTNKTRKATIKVQVKIYFS